MNLADDAMLRHRELTQEVYNIGDEVAQYVENLSEAIADWDAALVEDCLMEIAEILTEARDDARRVVAELVGVRHGLTSGIRSGTVSVWGTGDARKRTKKPRTITVQYLNEQFPLGDSPVIVREYTGALDARTAAVVANCQQLVEWVLECTALAADDLDALSLPLLYTQARHIVDAAAYSWLESVAYKHPAYTRTMRGSHPPVFLIERARVDAVVARVAAKIAAPGDGRAS